MRLGLEARSGQWPAGNRCPAGTCRLTAGDWNPDSDHGLRVRRADHDLADAQVRRAVGDAVGLRRLALGVAAGAEHPPRLLARDGVEVPPEVGGDRVVGDVAHHPRDLAVLDLPEGIAAELAVVALLVDGIAAAPV